VLAVIVTLVLAYRKIGAHHDEMIRRRGLYAVGAAVIITIAVCVVASDRTTTYRVLFALGGVILVMMVYALRTLAVAKKMRPGHYAGLAVICAVVAFLAHRNCFLLLAEPQAAEWDLMRGAVLRAGFTKPVRVHIIIPALSDRTTARIYGDEFGTISSDDEAVAANMFRAALRTRFPDKLPAGGSYKIATSTTDPVTGTYDLLIDMRKLKTMAP
jgi:hypothetical protein